jgi:hypothetical protein
VLCLLGPRTTLTARLLFVVTQRSYGGSGDAREHLAPAAVPPVSRASSLPTPFAPTAAHPGASPPPTPPAPAATRLTSTRGRVRHQPSHQCEDPVARAVTWTGQMHRRDGDKSFGPTVRRVGGRRLLPRWRPHTRTASCLHQAAIRALRHPSSFVRCNVKQR